MPSWKIHSKIANDLYKQLKVNKKYFMIGNLLPDQDKYNIPNINRSISRKVSHFISDEDFKIGINLPNYSAMFEKYKGNFENPVLLGYLVHLLTDFYWNNYIYNKYFIKNRKIDLKAIEDNIKSLIDIENPTRELLQTIIDKIIIDKDKNIEIIYKFSILNRI